MADTAELVAILTAALAQLQARAPGPAADALATQFAQWQTRHSPEAAGDTRVVVASILSARTKQGAVELTLGREKVQMDLDKAREVAGLLAGAIEAAVSDQLLFAFLTTTVGLKAEQAGAALLDFRALRQGSRGTVYPS